MNYKALIINFCSLGFLLGLVVITLTTGETKLDFSTALQGLFGYGEPETIFIMQTIRLPRIIAALCVGATLALSGLCTSIALNNELADSGILGIQSGATFFSLIIILVLPGLYFMLPLFAFSGGLLAFILVLFVGYQRKNATNQLILAGVAINAFFVALIGVLTIFNADKLKSTLAWLNGSLASISLNQMTLILLFSCLALGLILLFLPLLKILRLDDQQITNLGKNPQLIRLIVCFYAVFLASVSVAFVGIISFLGIIAPQCAALLMKKDFKYYIIQTLLMGSILVVGADLLQKSLFSPMEVPAGIIIGLFCAPIFLLLIWRQNHVKV